MTFWHRYRQTALAARGAVAVRDQRGQVLTHGELLDRSQSVAAGLAQLGLGPGAILGVFLPNRVSWVIAAVAAAKSGIGVLGLNTRFRHQELQHLLSVAEVDVVLVAHQFLGLDGPRLMEELERPLTVIVEDSGPTGEQIRPPLIRWSELLTGRTEPERCVADSPLIGFTTSGTTGFPKVAMHSQAQTEAHLLAVGRAFDLTTRSVNLAPLPCAGPSATRWPWRPCWPADRSWPTRPGSPKPRPPPSKSMVSPSPVEATTC